jgi:hypothetical protein
VADGFAQLQGTAADIEGSGFPADAAEAATGRTGLLLSEGLRLLLQEGGERSFGQPRGSSQSHLLHGGQIDVGSRSLLAKGTSGNYFTPLGGHFTDFLEVLGWSRTAL